VTPSDDSKRCWTTGELRRLRELASLGAAAAAAQLGRSVASVKGAAKRHRISLRRHGSRRGSVLGQPRGVSLRRAIRDDLVSGTVDAELIARRMAADRDAELCPCCGWRPIRVKTTGLCTCCHRDILIERHRECIDELLARRQIDRLKQQTKRLRDGAELQAAEWLG
jgi:hypothetical protein